MLHYLRTIGQQMETAPLGLRFPYYASLIKPSFDRCAALLGLLLLAPVLMVIAILIMLDSRGPVFFKQRRLGKNQQTFTIIKFRTMIDGKVTAIGGILRQTGLDELPQLWNILQGSMSWIGPRPLTEQDVHRLGWHQPYYHQRGLIKPGITGLAQLYGGVGRKVTWLCDRHYIQNLSLKMDLKILMASLLICILGKRFVRGQLYAQRANGERNTAQLSKRCSIDVQGIS